MLFCHHCGTIQPVRDLDFFARLGLERRLDLDGESLERQYTAMRRLLDPQRFALRGMGERAHAADQLQALETAYATLREPLRRARYWLGLHQQEPSCANDCSPTLSTLLQDLESASQASHCDSVAQRAGLAMEKGIQELMHALRSQSWQLARRLIDEIDGLEGILNNVRNRRESLTACAAGPADITRVR